ncbi:hypothetical protein MEX01_23670 [Methylorubrum extorquens]|uniref:curli production assembly/transport component CsgF n=1 Tax=Methylorubrum extorquens TaxID=408 RepID=UPI0011694DC8|nr:curli production assembly/transport component CsgF [Methylorubrum extorquens]GEL41776.1 hypothetical protein MEX01_23670 [Methylorubrum extorquens]
MKMRVIAAGAALVLGSIPVQAGNLVYQPVNPAFGGSPLNGGWLQSEAAAQNLPQAAQQRRQQLFNSQQSLTGSGTLTPGQVFAQQLQSQLYSSLANQITRSIFGENAQQSGTFSFQGTTIDFVRVGANVRVTINDGQTITQVVVPATP